MNPHYPSGEPIRADDNVLISGRVRGKILAVFEARQFSKLVIKDHWSSYDRGILTISKEDGLVMYDDPECYSSFQKLDECVDLVGVSHPALTRSL